MNTGKNGRNCSDLLEIGCELGPRASTVVVSACNMGHLPSEVSWVTFTGADVELVYHLTRGIAEIRHQKAIFVSC